MPLRFPYQSRFEPVTVNPVLWLRADSGIGVADGAPVTSWTSKDGLHAFVQATSTKQPTFAASVSALNDKPAVLFDGTDDILVKASGFLSGPIGTVFVVVKLTDTSMIQTAIGSADEAVVTFWICRVAINGKMQLCVQYDGGTQNQIDSASNVTTDRMVLMYGTSGSAYELEFNGTAETESVGSGADTGEWIGDCSGLDNVTLGGLKISTEVQFLKGYLAEVRVYDFDLSSQAQADINTELLAYYTPSSVPDMDSWWRPTDTPTRRKQRVRLGLSETPLAEIIPAPTVPDMSWWQPAATPLFEKVSHDWIPFTSNVSVSVPSVTNWYQPASLPVIRKPMLMEWQTPMSFGPIIPAPTVPVHHVVEAGIVKPNKTVVGMTR